MREERLQERVAQIRPKLGKGRQLAELAESENREFTAEEKATYDSIMTEGRDVADAVKAHRHDQEVWAFAKELGAEVIGPMGGVSPLSGKGQRLSFKGMGAKVATAMLGVDGTKALAPSGAAVVAEGRRSRHRCSA